MWFSIFISLLPSGLKLVFQSFAFGRTLCRLCQKRAMCTTTYVFWHLWSYLMQAMPATCHVDYNICILTSLVVPYASYARNVPCGLQHMYSDIFGRTLCRLCQKRAMWTTTYLFWNLWSDFMQAIPETCHVDYNICILKSVVVLYVDYSRNVPCGPQHMYSEIFGRTLCMLFQKRAMWTTAYVFWNLWSYLMQAIPETCHVDHDICILKSLVVPYASYSRNVPCGLQHMYSEIFGRTLCKLFQKRAMWTTTYVFWNLWSYLMQAIPETCHVDYNICILKSLVVPYASYSRNVPCGLQHMYSEVFGHTLCRLFQKRAMWTTTYVFWNLSSYLMQAIPEPCHVDYNICILKSLVVPYAGYARNVPCGLQHMYSEIFGRTLCRLFQKRAMWTTTYVFWNLWSYLMQAMPETCHVDYNICILKSLVVTYAGYSRNVPCGPQHMYSEIFGRTLCRLCQKRAMWTTTYVF